MIKYGRKVKAKRITKLLMFYRKLEREKPGLVGGGLLCSTRLPYGFTASLDLIL